MAKTVATTPDQEKKLAEIINSLRVYIGDLVASRNILNGGKQEFTDTMLIDYIDQGLKDLNGGVYKTNFTVFDFPDEDLLVKSAQFIFLISEGILQLKNQIDYSDGGFNLAMFNKTAGYQGWAGFILQSYIMGKAEFKSSQVYNANGNSGFYGISSEFGIMGGGDDDW